MNDSHWHPILNFSKLSMNKITKEETISFNSPLIFWLFDYT